MAFDHTRVFCRQKQRLQLPNWMHSYSPSIFAVSVCACVLSRLFRAVTAVTSVSTTMDVCFIHERGEGRANTQKANEDVGRGTWQWFDTSLSLRSCGGIRWGETKVEYFYNVQARTVFHIVLIFSGICLIAKFLCLWNNVNVTIFKMLLYFIPKSKMVSLCVVHG